MMIIDLDTALNEQAAQPASLDRAVSTKIPKDASPAYGHVLFAQLDTENDTIGLVRALNQDNTVSDPTYNRLATIKGTKYEPFAEDFAYADSDEDVEDRKLAIDRQLESKRIISEASTFTQISTGLHSGLMNISNLVPVGGFFKAMKLVSGTGKRALAGAIAGTGAGVLGAATSEAILQPAQITRTPGETAANIVVGGMFGAVLGGGFGALTMHSLERSKDIMKNILFDNEGKVQINSDGSGTLKYDSTAGAAFAYNEGFKEAQSIANVPRWVIKAADMQWFGLGSPQGKAFGGDFGTNMQLADNLFNHGYITGKNYIGIKNADSMEKMLNQDAAKISILASDINKQFRKTLDLDNKWFAEERAAISGLRNPDVSYGKFSNDVQQWMVNPESRSKLSPEVNAVGASLRQALSANYKRMVELGISPKKSADELDTYSTVIWNHSAIDANRGKFEAELSAIIKRIDEEEGLKLQGNDYYGMKASDTADHILGMNYKAALEDDFDAIVNPKEVNILTKRILDYIKRDELLEFKDNDAIGNALSYLYKSNKLIRLHERFSDMNVENINDILKNVETEGRSLGKSSDQIKAAQQDAIDMLKIMLDKYKLDTKADSALRYLRHYQTITLLGGVVISSISDAAMAPFKFGPLRTMKQGYVSGLKSFMNKTLKANNENLRYMGVGVEGEMDTALRAFDHNDYNFTKKTAADSFIDYQMNKFGKITGLTYWNNFGKRNAGRISASGLADSIINYKSLTEYEKAYLGSLSIDKSMASKIADQLNRFKVNESVPNTRIWKDKQAADVFGGAVQREVDGTIITPSKGEIPKIMQRHDAMKNVLQFSTFLHAASHKILLSGLNRRDAHVAMGYVALIFMGHMSYAIKQSLAGKEVDYSPDAIFREGAVKSGVLGALQKPLGLASGVLSGYSEKFLGFGIPFAASDKYAAKNVRGLLLGASGDSIVTAAELLEKGGRADYEYTNDDMKRLKRFIPYQNLQGITQSLDAVFGIERGE